MARNLKTKSRTKPTTDAPAAYDKGSTSRANAPAARDVEALRNGKSSRDRKFSRDVIESLNVNAKHSPVETEQPSDANIMAIRRMMVKHGKSSAECARIDALSDEEFNREVRDYRERNDARAAAIEAAERKSGKRRYEHTAYWHAKQTAKIVEKRKRDRREAHRKDPFLFSNEFISEYTEELRHIGDYDTLFSKPFGFAIGLSVCMAADFGYLAYDTVRCIADPEERAKAKREIQRNLRIVRRPFYYAHETERRRQLAAERRKIKRRTTLAPCPTADEILDLWRRRKESKENMIRLGGMLQDLECYVDNRLRYDENGAIVGRHGGIRGWLETNLPELFPRYKTLMRYKAMAIKLRQATETKDPTPTSALLDAEPRCELVEELLKDFRMTFSFLEHEIDVRLGAEMVFREETVEEPQKWAPEAKKPQKLDTEKTKRQRSKKRLRKTYSTTHT